MGLSLIDWSGADLTLSMFGRRGGACSAASLLVHRRSAEAEAAILGCPGGDMPPARADRGEETTLCRPEVGKDAGCQRVREGG
jgi:hypothetical protein